MIDNTKNCTTKPDLDIISTKIGQSRIDKLILACYYAALSHLLAFHRELADLDVAEIKAAKQQKNNPPSTESEVRNDQS